MTISPSQRTAAQHGCPACELVKTAAVANWAGEWLSFESLSPKFTPTRAVWCQS